MVTIVVAMGVGKPIVSIGCQPIPEMELNVPQSSVYIPNFRVYHSRKVITDTAEDESAKDNTMRNFCSMPWS